MQDVPKIVRDRLRRAGSKPAETHPDADLLTAFAEQSLAADEREHVLRHLAHCGDCREIVHLALPATEVAAPAAFGSRTQAGWLRWRVLRWGVVAAGILAVMSIGVLRLSHRHDKSLFAIRLMPQDQLASAEKRAPRDLSTSSAPTSTSPMAASSLPAEEAGKHAETRKKVISAQALSADKATTTTNAVFPRPNQFHGGVSSGAVAGSSAGASFGGPLRRDITPNRPLAFAPAGRSAPAAAPAKQSPPLPAASEAVEVSGAAPPTQTEAAVQNATQDQLVQNQAGKLQASGEQVEAVVRAKPTSSQVNGMASSDELRYNSTLMKSPAPRWTIGANGALQRSLDGGKTWLDVNLAVDSSMNSNLVGQSNSQLMIAKSSRARSEMKADSKSAATPAPTPPVPAIFRALAISSNAAEVWAGGSAGILYHTMDGGNLWVRVIPSDAGIVLSGDIVSIQFSDSRNGTVTTSNAAAWTTKDDGQSWHKQQ